MRGKEAHGMQFLLMQFGANAAKGQLALGGTGDGTPAADDGLEPIIIDLNEDATQERAWGFIYRAAELLIASVSGCAPKRKR